MKLKLLPLSLALVLIACATITLSLTSVAATVSAFSERSRDLHVTKECSQFTGAPGSFCTITSSNLAAIRVGSKVIYDQAPGIPAGMLDSNVILDAGNGNRAIGRCTLDGATGLGLCRFVDGTGEFAGFEARINVTYTGGPTYRWDGTCSFDSEDEKRERDR
jgi:hypothetical protein